MAAPFVTGTVALVEAAHPTWSMSQVVNAVVNHTTPDPALAGLVTSGGVLNAAAAVANTDGAYVTSATPNGQGTSTSPLSSIQVAFNEEINPATFTPSQVTLTGPGGAISKVTISVVAGSNDHQFVIAFPSQTAGGTYTLKVGPSVQDWYGNSMDQNRNGVNGEASDAFVYVVRAAPRRPWSIGTPRLRATGSAPTAPRATTSSATRQLSQLRHRHASLARRPGPGPPPRPTPARLADAGGSGRTAACWYGTSFTVDVNLTDGQAHDIGPLCPRLAERRAVRADSGHQAPPREPCWTPRPSRSFSGGRLPPVGGHRQRADHGHGMGGCNAVLSGLFFDPPTQTSDVLSVSSPSTTDTAGTAQNFTVTAFSPNGKIDTNYTGTIHFTSTDSHAVLPADYTFTAADAGVHTFTAALETVGTQSVTATDTANQSTTGTESNITVMAAAAASLTVTGFPNPDNGGTAGNFTVTAYDRYGNLATGYTGTVHFTSSDPQASLPANYTFTATDAGKHNFSAMLMTPGTQSITATATAPATITGIASVTVISSVNASAALIKQDSTTQGNWIGTYGSQGYNVIGNTASYPSYATVTPTGQYNLDLGAPARPTLAPSRTSADQAVSPSCWYATTFSVDVNLTDGQTHDLALYAIDWPNAGRSEQIQITNALTGAILNTETISSFSGGAYLQWAVSGNVVITFTSLAGPNAVLSGLFFDPPSSPPSPATASFIKSDTTTQGNWIGTYGSQGYNVTGNAASYPSYATVTPTGESTWTWAASTTDPRALQNVGGSGRAAMCWYATTFSVDVNLTDGQTHDLALYAIDWPNAGRSEQIQITNALTGAILNTETISSFSGGIYLQWAVSGNVVIKFTGLAGPNAVMSGLFLDPASSSNQNATPIPAATASFVKSDTTTQGNWIGTYGSQGYNVIGNAASDPSYATVTPNGQSTYTWAASTTDPRALQTVGGSGRTAMCWYGSSFSIDVNLTDGQTHNVALYAVDWPNVGRSERIQITSAATGAVLDTETLSSFSGGIYLQWAVSGNVVIKFTSLAGPNAVVSGLFFDPASGAQSVATASLLGRDTRDAE